MATDKPLSHVDKARITLYDAVETFDEITMQSYERVPILLEIAKVHALLAIYERLGRVGVYADVNILE